MVGKRSSRFEISRDKSRRWLNRVAFHEASGSCLLASGTLLSHRESAGSIDNAMPLRATLHRAATFYRKGKRPYARGDTRWNEAACDGSGCRWWKRWRWRKGETVGEEKEEEVNVEKPRRNPRRRCIDSGEQPANPTTTDFQERSPSLSRSRCTARTRPRDSTTFSTSTSTFSPTM